MTTNPLTIQAPAPGALFSEHYIDPHNLELINNEDKARQLTGDERKHFKAERKRLEAELNAGRYDERQQYAQRAKHAYKQARIQLQRATDARDRDQARRQLAKIKRAAATNAAALETMKPAAEALHNIELREREHAAAIQYEARAAADRDEMLREAAHFWSRISERYAQLKYRDDQTKDGKHIRIKVKAAECYVTEDEIIYKLDVSQSKMLGSTKINLPDGVRVRDLTSIETLDELSVACERPVYSPHNDGVNYDHGAWIVVSRLSMRGGLPEYIELGQVLSKYRQDEKHRFPLPFGIKRGRIINWCNLDEHAHIMVSGQTWAGKTNAIRVALCTLIQMHSPDEIRFILADLKRGGDFNQFADTPHNLREVIKTPADLAATLASLVKHMYDRLEIIAPVTVDLIKYNAMADAADQMPRLIVVVDEFSAINTDRDAAKEIKHYTGILATQARAAGITLILGNQQPYAKDMEGIVKGNMTFKLAGRQMELGASYSATGGAAATKIKRIPGRMICNDGRDQYQVQIPYATPQNVAIALRAAKNWQEPRPLDLPTADDIEALQTSTKRKFWGVEEVIELALNELDGDLKAVRLWELVKPDISNAKMREIVAEIVNNDSIEHGDNTYLVERQRGNFYKLIQTTTGADSS